MFSVNDRQIKEFEKDLKVFAKRAYPFATRNTINSAAFAAQKTAKTIVKNSMIQRNSFTLRSIRVDPARGLDVRTQEAVVGSTADYMEDQEFGVTQKKTGKHGKAIPTSYAAGQGNSRRRTKVPQKPNKLVNIRLRKSRSKGNKKQRNLIAIKSAAKSKRKYVFLELSRRKGLFRVLGGKRKPRIRMVHDLTHKSVRIPPNPWLIPAVIATQKKIPGIYKKSLQFQLRRLGLFN